MQGRGAAIGLQGGWSRLFAKAKEPLGFTGEEKPQGWGAQREQETPGEGNGSSWAGGKSETWVRAMACNLFLVWLMGDDLTPGTSVSPSVKGSSNSVPSKRVGGDPNEVITQKCCATHQGFH